VDAVSVTTLVGAAGFAAGILFGAVAHRTNFCTMGALSDIVFMDDWRRFRSWMLAVAVAIVGTHALHLSGLIDVDRSIYMSGDLGWFGAIMGGLMFGYGMTLAGGCANKMLVRIGGGNLKSIVVALVVGLFAYMTMRGLLGVLRVRAEELANVDLTGRGLDSQGLGAMLAAATGVDAETARLVLAAPAAAALLWFCFRDGSFRASPRHVVGGLAVGALVPLGWWITGVLGADDFEPAPLASFSFVGPAGESLQYLMTFSGATISFGVASVAGVVVGAFLSAVAGRSFRLEAFADAADMLRHLGGAALMGTGGVLALGCTIGQGITGISTLALGSVLALAAIIAGGWLGLRSLEAGSLRDALRAVVMRA
jgi:uncharacterized membrane protein YedE/YeeE